MKEDLNSSIYPFSDLTKFEYYVMPLKQMGLHDFERRLKKLAYKPRQKDEDSSSYRNEIVSLRQLQASFGDDLFMREQLYDKDSIMFQLMTDEIFHYKENQFDSGYDYMKEEFEQSVLEVRQSNDIVLTE